MPRHVTAGRAWALALGATGALLASAFIGRAVTSADDGAEMMSDTLGFLVQGRFESGTLPPEALDPLLPPLPSFRSRYGIIPSLVPLPFVGAAWPFRRHLGAAAVDACAAMTWAAGAALAAIAFHRLARSLKPDLSPLWIPGFLGGTYLWTYAADSFIEPWAAAGLAFSGAELLSGRDLAPPRATLTIAAGCVLACWLRPVLWVTAPAVLLAALLAWNHRPDGARRGVWLLAWLVLGLAVIGAINAVRHGSATDFGHGFSGSLPFVHSPLAGLVRYTIDPGRGVLFYAPIIVAALAMARRLSWSARVLCFGVPVVLLLVAPRWFVWHGGSCWGPRFLLPVLPLIAAPAALAPARAARALLTLGLILNLPGVLVAPGAFQTYAEELLPPPGAEWPSPGGDRVSEVAVLTPLYGHVWLLSTSLAPGRLPAPWIERGARQRSPAPPLAAFLSPWLARRAVGLQPASPFLPRLLVRSAVGYLSRGRPTEAARFAEEALTLDPGDRDAATILTEARRSRP
jgi:hypothetical protein